MKINLTMKLITAKKGPLWERDPAVVATRLLAFIKRVIAEKMLPEELAAAFAEFEKENRQVELRDILIAAIGVAPQERKGFTGYEKRRRWRLQNQIADNEEIDFSVEDLSMLKEAVAEGFDQPVIVGQVWDILDPTDEAKPKAQPKETIPAG